MRALVLDEICKLPGRGLELGIRPDGRLHAVTGDGELKKPGLMGSTWTTFDLAGDTVDEQRFHGPIWLPVFWKGHILTAIADSRQAERGHYQHRSRLVLLGSDEPKTLDEFEWECYADRPNAIGDYLWIGVSRGTGAGRMSFAWRWDGREIHRFPIGRKMDWMSTPIDVSAGVLASEVESLMLKEEKAGAVCFLANGKPVTKTPWIQGGGEMAGRVFWIRERLWVHTSRGVLECFAFEGSKLAQRKTPAFLGPATGLSKDAPARLVLYDLLGESACAHFEPELRLEWVVPVDDAAIVGFWSFRKFTVRRVRADGSTESEVTLPSGGVAMRKPVAHPLAGIIGLLSDGSVVTVEDARGTSTAIIPSMGF
ncbi:MAG: hypothetical protein K8T20_02500 [Planctomycetes bacterium]|nr:hypothetical protein [Planctomycetota bacterium]